LHSLALLSPWRWTICTVLCYYHLDGENVTFLIMPEITAGDCNVLDSGWL
jgi:hypothetical protein